MAATLLTSQQGQILRNQVIDATRPGPLLHDFQLVLDYVGPQGVKAAGKYNLLPMESIGKLDPHLSRPLQLDLKRPQLRSHPYLQGLHLLLRASGISRVEGIGDKARLMLDPTVFEQWQRLNPTEQYFNLLEAWLLEGRPEMIGERGSPWSDRILMLMSLQEAWKKESAKANRNIASNQWLAHILGFGYALYHLALMDLFGLVEVKHPIVPLPRGYPTEPQLAPFGDALFTLLGRGLPARGAEEDIPDEDIENEEDEEGEEVIGFGRWQPIFQPYFPDWQQNLILPGNEMREGIFVFRVSLGKIWRLIAISAHDTLHDLVYAILESVDFDDDHLYQWTYRDRFGAEVKATDPRGGDGLPADEVAIGHVPLARDSRCNCSMILGTAGSSP